MSPGTFFDLPNFSDLWSWLPDSVTACLMLCLVFMALIGIKRMVV